MHEFSVMSYLLESVEEQARQHGARKVVTINMIMGERASVMDDSLLFYFDLLTPGTMVEGARLVIRRTLMQFACANCGKNYHPSGADFSCPDCGQVGQVTSDGSELLIESIEIEE